MADDLLVDALGGDDEPVARFSREELLSRGAAVGLAAPSLSLLFAGRASAASRPLTPTFYQWIYNNYPDIPAKINPEYSTRHRLNAKIAPVKTFGIERFVAEAKQKKSTWDVYVGTTPFVELAQLAETGAIEPWDRYMPASVKNDIVPSILNEVQYQGKIYSWPFLLDIAVQARNGSLVAKAGLDPKRNPATWDEFISLARQVVAKKAAPFGATFDARGWRSLAPITHTFSTDVYYGPAGLFNFTHPAAVSALEMMKQIFEVGNPDMLDPAALAAAVDEQVFAAQQVAYYVKYQNAPIRAASNWSDPLTLRMAALPKQEGGAGASLFWTTGAALFKYGQNKQLAAEYMRFLTYSPIIWQSAANPRGAGGQLAPYLSLWDSWSRRPPGWMPKWWPLVFSQLRQSVAIHTNKFGLQQFKIGQPYWETYLKGEERNPTRALLAAKNAVYKEFTKA